METRQIDLLNIGLILGALLAAFLLPFELFLFSYAVLGPLHYITEISWLDERKYFTPSRYLPWALGGLVTLMCVATFYRESERQSVMLAFKLFVDGTAAQGLILLIVHNYAHLLFMSLVVAVAFTAVTDRIYRWLVVAMGAGVAMLFHGNGTYLVVAGTILPTILHVSIFTGLFMLYGAMKTNSKPGFWAVGLFVLAQLLVFYVPIHPENYFLAEAGNTHETMAQSGFSTIMGQLGKFFGQPKQVGESFLNSEAGVRLGIYFAFIYTYHYLNWFSKTSIIGWHKVTKRKLIGGLAIWIAAVGLYGYNYRLGLLSLLFLSLMHVVLEFPLNYLSVKGIWEGLGPKPKLGKN